MDFKLFDLTFPHSEPVTVGMYVDGKWSEAEHRALIEVENPSDETIIASIVEGTADDASIAIETAHRASTGWAKYPAIERAKLVMALARKIETNRDLLANIVTLEQGKPLSQARGEIDAAVTFLTYAAEQARRIEGDILVSDNANEEIHMRRHPHGVVVGLTAWNYPAALAARKLGPALVAGNTFVLMAHENTPLSGLAMAQLAHDVGFPPGVFNCITGRGREAGQAMVQHPLTGLVSMTGSTRAGKEIYRAAADWWSDDFGRAHRNQDRRALQWAGGSRA